VRIIKNLLKRYWKLENVEFRDNGDAEHGTDPPSRLTTARKRGKFELHGTVCDVHKGRSWRPRTATINESSTVVLERFHTSPQKSIMQCARKSGASAPRVLRKRFYYEQDGAPPHYHTDVRAYIDQNVSGHWIGRRGPIDFQPRSPDLTPLEFYLWGTAKDKVYRKRPDNLDTLWDEIKAACAEIPLQTLVRVTEAVGVRIQRCNEMFSIALKFSN
jgi:hypothetical protein